MEIAYHWEGDYLIPDLKLSDTTEYHIGKYGRMRKRFLEENRRGNYSHMLLSETLWKHLAEIDEECNEMMDRLVGQMAKKEGVTEQQNPMTGSVGSTTINGKQTCISI